MRSKPAILLFALISIIVVFNRSLPKHNQFSSDKCGYYLYLPAIFIYHDLDKLAFYPGLNRSYDYSLSVHYSLYDVNGNKLNKYPVGVAFFELPLFLIANTYCSLDRSYKQDGFSLPYQYAGIFSNILVVILGLFILRRLQLKYFNETVTTITIICIALGTNLYAYTAFETGMSHPYSFFLIAALLFHTDRIYEEVHPKAISIVWAGIILGCIVIVRPVNIICILIPFLWKVNSLPSLKSRISFLRVNIKPLLLSAACFASVVFIQLAYWKYITGNWTVYTYKGESFDFLRPNIINGLFSYRKGWILYTPMIVIGFTGLFFLKGKLKSLMPAITLFMLIAIYVVFSWREWWYGGSFGCRVLIEALPLLSIPLAAATTHFLYQPSTAKKTTYITLLCILITLNMFQTYQYSMGLIHWSRMTSRSYWHVFGQLDPDRVKYEEYLIKEDEQYYYDQ